MDRGAWWATVHSVSKSWTQLVQSLTEQQQQRTKTVLLFWEETGQANWRCRDLSESSTMGKGIDDLWEIQSQTQHFMASSVAETNGVGANRTHGLMRWVGHSRFGFTMKLVLPGGGQVLVFSVNSASWTESS